MISNSIKFCAQGLMLAGLIFGPATIANAQRNFKVSLVSTNQNGIAITWKAQSATPVGDLFIIPQFRVERSADLKIWAPISGLLTGSLNQTMSLVIPIQTAGATAWHPSFKRNTRELNGVKLDSGQLAGADFFGAKLFGAHLSLAESDRCQLQRSRPAQC